MVAAWLDRETRIGAAGLYDANAADLVQETYLRALNAKECPPMLSHRQGPSRAHLGE